MVVIISVLVVFGVVSFPLNHAICEGAEDYDGY